MKVRKSSSRKSNTRENIGVALPSDYAWRVLSKVVSDLDHLLTDEEKTTIATVIRNRDYESYVALSETWGPQCMPTSENLPVRLRAKYQIVSLLKKFRFPTSDKARREAALKKFWAAERSCAMFNAEGVERLLWLKEEDRMLGVFSHAQAFLLRLLGVTLPEEKILTHWSRHGPGANLDTKRGNTSLYFKYSEWPYSCTKGALALARSAIEGDERWLGALEDDYRDRYQIPRHTILDRELFWSTVLQVVPGNRITFVPKNSQTDRSIAIEPSMNLYLQLGVDGYIRRRLKRWGVDLDSQEKNRELARVGSVRWQDPDSFVTLDLAAASDSISVAVCRALLPPIWFSHLMKLRSPYGELDGEMLQYHKISSMGNGFTFALETAIFTALIYGVFKEFRGSFDRQQAAVFGDDLIVPRDLAGPVIEMLNLCGFTLNMDKSFLEGPFRESCGADWYSGAPMRPVFFSSQPRSVFELWNDINRLQRQMALWFMVDEPSSVSEMVKWIPDKFRSILGPYSDEQFDSYLHSPKPNVAYRNGVWKYRTLVATPKPLRGDKFLFRKLMHSLRGDATSPAQYPSPRDTWFGATLGAGSRFTVTRSNAVTVGYTHSVASDWRSEYAAIRLVPVPGGDPGAGYR